MEIKSTREFNSNITLKGKAPEIQGEKATVISRLWFEGLYFCQTVQWLQNVRVGNPYRPFENKLIKLYVVINKS